MIFIPNYLKLLINLLIVLLCITSSYSKTECLVSAYHTNSSFAGGHLQEIGINNFDLAIAHLADKMAQHTTFLNRVFILISANNFLKGGIMMLAFWWYWFAAYPSEEHRSWVRVRIISGLFASFIAMFIARVLVMVMPFRARPIHTQGLGITVPPGAAEAYIEKLSSFPSDHAVMFFAISTVLFTINKKAGILAYMYTAVFITLSRVYLCYHWATDVLAGAAIGVLITLVIVNIPLVDKWAYKLYHYSTKRYPALFFCTFFFITYELSNMFNELRSIISFIDHIHI